MRIRIMSANPNCLTGKSDWGTPDWLFNWFNNEFHFTIDGAAGHRNHKCNRYITAEEDFFKEAPYLQNERIWINPPYTRGMILKFVEMSIKICSKNDLIALLLPYDATKYTRLCHENAYRIYLLSHRIRFVGAEASPPFSSMVVLFDKDRRYTQYVYKDIASMQPETFEKLHRGK